MRDRVAGKTEGNEKRDDRQEGDLLTLDPCCTQEAREYSDD